MTKLVLLDCCTLGLIAHPANAGDPCRRWATDLRRKDVHIKVPEIADYELRRELIRLNSGAALAELDRLIEVFGYVPLCTLAMRKAAEFWAIARRDFGRAAAGDHRLDADMILCGQAFAEAQNGYEKVAVATDNVGHLNLFATALLWEDIGPDF